jgi:septal ring factor EnvC (AmiA/AmiB activator)
VHTRLKEAEAKSALPSTDSAKFKGQLKERDDKIAEMTKDLSEARHTVENLTKDLSEARGKVESLSVELQASRKTSSEISRQLKDQTKKMDEFLSVEKQRQRIIAEFIQQFDLLEKNVSTSKDDYTAQGYIREYNAALQALKKELESDEFCPYFDASFRVNSSLS